MVRVVNVFLYSVGRDAHRFCNLFEAFSLQTFNVGVIVT